MPRGKKDKKNEQSDAPDEAPADAERQQKSDRKGRSRRGQQQVKVTKIKNATLDRRGRSKTKSLRKRPVGRPKKEQKPVEENEEEEKSAVKTKEKKKIEKKKAEKKKNSTTKRGKSKTSKKTTSSARSKRAAEAKPYKRKPYRKAKHDPNSIYAVHKHYFTDGKKTEFKFTEPELSEVVDDVDDKETAVKEVEKTQEDQFDDGESELDPNFDTPNNSLQFAKESPKMKPLPAHHPGPLLRSATQEEKDEKLILLENVPGKLGHGWFTGEGKKYVGIEHGEGYKVQDDLHKAKNKLAVVKEEQKNAKKSAKQKQDEVDETQSEKDD